MYETSDPAGLLRRYTVMMGALATQAAPIYDVLVRASDAEAELAELLADFEQQRLRASTMVADAVAQRGGLPDGCNIDEVHDTIWVLNAPELYLALTRNRRWSTKRYVTWAATALTKLVLEPDNPRRHQPHRKARRRDELASQRRLNVPDGKVALNVAVEGKLDAVGDLPVTRRSRSRAADRTHRRGRGCRAGVEHALRKGGA